MGGPRLPAEGRWWLLGGMLVIALLAAQERAQGFVVDDAYIVFRYVDHVAAGDGLVYNVGERVEGFSCPSWVVLLGLLRAIGLKATWTAPLLGMAATVGAGLATGIFLERRLELPLPQVVLAPLCLVSSWPVAFWAGAGLETGLFLLALTLTALWATQERPLSGRHGWWLALGAALLATTRPEGPLFAAAALAYALVAHARQGGRLADAATRLVAVALVAAAALGARWLYYGDLLPNTYYAKVGGGGAALDRGLDYLRGYGLRAWGAGLLALAAAGALLAWRRTVLLAPLLLALSGLGFLLAVGGDGLYSYRFVAQIAGPLVILAAAASAALDGRVRYLGSALLICAGLAGAVTTASLLPGVTSSHLRRSEDRWEAIGRALHDALPPDATLATNVAGKLPYHARRPTMDLLGLTHRGIARSPAPAMGAGYAGHEKQNPALLLEEAPDLVYLSVIDPVTPTLLADGPRIAAGLANTPLRGYASLPVDERFVAAYQPALLRVGPEPPATVYVKRAFVDRLGPGQTVLDARPWSAP